MKLSFPSSEIDKRNLLAGLSVDGSWSWRKEKIPRTPLMTPMASTATAIVGNDVQRWFEKMEEV
jgi:hypothetical protein